MSVDFSYINKRMLIGGHITSQSDFDMMVGLGVTDFICLLSTGEKYHDTLYRKPSNVNVLCVPTYDDHLTKSQEWFEQIIPFALAVLSQPNRKIFCHCAAGKSRSALAWFAILFALGFTGYEVENMITAGRPQVTFWPKYRDSAMNAIEIMGYA